MEHHTSVTSSSLTSEALQQLIPLLGSLARLVAGGSRVSDSELQILLLGVECDDEDTALGELRRWSRLLSVLQAQPTPDNRAAIIEALHLRGLPEASVMLTVTAVASGTDVQTQPVGVLRVTPDRLDFGTLPSGQSASATFTVEGAAGKIVSESD